MTVGIPTATTGTPSSSRVSAARWFPTPDPGATPASAICTVVSSRSALRAASASSASTASG